MPPARATATRHDLPRGWIPLLVAVAILLLQAFTRRTAALAVVALALLPRAAAASGDRTVVSSRISGDSGGS